MNITITIELAMQMLGHRRIHSFFPFILVLATGCATRSVSNDVREVNEFLAAQGRGTGLVPARVHSVAMPDEEAWENDAEEAPRILAKPLAADDAVKLALLQNRDLRAAMYELGIARGQFIQAGLLPNPELDVSLRESADPFQRIQADIGIEYNLSALVMVPQRKAVAEAELSATRVRVASQVLETALQARIAFYEVQARQSMLELRARAFDAFQAGYAAAQELHRVGNLLDVDLATHRAAVESSRIDVAEAENALLDARERLNMAVGLSGEQTNWKLAGPLLPVEDFKIDTSSSEKRAIRASLELSEIGRRMIAAARRVGLHQTEGALPHLSGGFHGEQDGTAWELGGHVTVGVPIFDRAQGRIISAKSELGVLRERYLSTAIALRSTTRMVQNRVESAGLRAKHYQQAVLPAREKALAETLLQYNAMHVSVFQVLDAQRRVTETAIAYTETLLDYWKARAALDQLFAGGRRPGSFSPVGVGQTSSPAMDSGAAAGH